MKHTKRYRFELKEFFTIIIVCLCFNNSFSQEQEECTDENINLNAFGCDLLEQLDKLDIKDSCVKLFEGCLNLEDVELFKKFKNLELIYFINEKSLTLIKECTFEQVKEISIEEDISKESKDILEEVFPNALWEFNSNEKFIINLSQQAGVNVSLNNSKSKINFFDTVKCEDISIVGEYEPVLLKTDVWFENVSNLLLRFDTDTSSLKHFKFSNENVFIKFYLNSSKECEFMIKEHRSIKSLFKGHDISFYLVEDKKKLKQRYEEELLTLYSDN